MKFPILPQNWVQYLSFCPHLTGAKSKPNSSFLEGNPLLPSLRLVQYFWIQIPSNYLLDLASPVYCCSCHKPLSQNSCKHSPSVAEERGVQESWSSLYSDRSLQKSHSWVKNGGCAKELLEPRVEKTNAFPRVHHPAWALQGRAPTEIKTVPK